MNEKRKQERDKDGDRNLDHLETKYSEGLGRDAAQLLCTKITNSAS